MDSDSERESGSEVEVFQVVLDAQSIVSSEDPSMAQWSSLIIQTKSTENDSLCRANGEPYVAGSGLLCTKNIPMSASSMFRHPYYQYPCVLDPGIEEALFKPVEKMIYTSDGQDLYMAVCEEMDIPPIKLFHRQLLTKTIDLKYYGINAPGARAMAIALESNKIVKLVDLTDNFLDPDACYHLGHLMLRNNTINEMILTGCKVGPVGARMFLHGLIGNTSLVKLKLNRNSLGDEGVNVVAEALASGIGVLELVLSYNDITSSGLELMARQLEFRNKLVYIDLSWNNFSSPDGFNMLMNRFVENEHLAEVHLSHCALEGYTTGLALRTVMFVRTLRVLNISYNSLRGDALEPIKDCLTDGANIVTLDLSNNPLTNDDAIKFIYLLRFDFVPLQNLLMDNVKVNTKFITLLHRMKALDYRAGTVVTYGEVIKRYSPVGADPRELVLNRADFLLKQGKEKEDIALVLMGMAKYRETSFITEGDLKNVIKRANLNLDEHLLDEFVAAFPGPRVLRSKSLSLAKVVDYMKRKWPDRKLPPTPPLSPPSVPPPPPKNSKQKKKK